jgi:dihydrolipoamide dehydrogenase
MDKMTEYDVIVIGAGPGGYVNAIKASQLGMKAAIIDKRWLGGVCLNVGCIPSKALLKNAEIAHLLRERGQELGFSFDNLQLDYGSAVKRSRLVSERLTKGVGFLMRKNNIDVHMGAAKLLSKSEVEVTAADGSKELLTAKNIVIATGAYASGIPGIVLDGEKVITYQEAILETTLPKSVVIIGAGALGLEFATVWSGYGSEVTLVEMMPHIAPLEDEEVSTELAKALGKRGIKVMAGTKVQSVKATPEDVEVVVSGADGEVLLKAEQALVAIGFKPNSGDLALEAAGVALSPRGFVEVDERMATNVPGIWAIGDITGKLLLAHVASTQAILCAEAMVGKETRPIDYTMVPRATYSHPQVASFGWTEGQVKEKGIDYKVGKFNLMANGKALGLGEQTGFIKIIVDANSGQLLGAHMIGAEVSELLPELTLAQRNGLTIEEIARNIHAHPTLSEAVMEAAHGALGEPIHM